MPIKKYRPTSPGRRFMSVSAFDEITRGKKAEKRLLVSMKTDAGRNAQGKITVRHQGGGHRKLYRLIDFKRNKLNIQATVSAVEVPVRDPLGSQLLQGRGNEHPHPLVRRRDHIRLGHHLPG